MTTPLTSYQKRLFAFLSIATFFEGYDMFALTQILPNLQQEFALENNEIGVLMAVVNFGTLLAYLLVRRADVWGRRRVMMITIVGYTTFTLLSGLAWDVWSFAFFQFIARFFLIGEWAISMVYAAEEYPAERRGMVIGVLTAFASLGAILCAGVAPLLLETAYGWRAVYLVGVLPLVILAFARRNLKETARFAKLRDERAATNTRQGSFFAIWKTPYRKRVVQVGSIWFLTYICTQNAISFWKSHAVTPIDQGGPGLSDGEVGAALVMASLAAMPMVFFSGKLLDLIGRRAGAAIIFSLTSIGVFLAYTITDKTLLTVSITLAVFGVSAVLPVLNAFTTELFPTDYRGDAFAWCNNVIGRTGYVLSPILVGQIAASVGWGPAMRPTAIAPLLALVLILVLMPETNKRELEDTSSL